MTGSTAAFLFDPAGPFSSSPSDVGKSVKFQFQGNIRGGVKVKDPPQIGCCEKEVNFLFLLTSYCDIKVFLKLGDDHKKLFSKMLSS